MIILEARFGLEGYAFWFKLLETLGDTDGHYFRAGNTADLEYLAAKCRLTSDRVTEILVLLADLEAIDKPLWDTERGIWSDNFTRRLSHVYGKRATEIPPKPQLPARKIDESVLSGAEMAQREVKRSKGKKRKEKEDAVAKAPPPPPVKYLDGVYLTDIEYSKLVGYLGDKEAVDGLIRELDIYLVGKPADFYVSHYKTIRKWHEQRIKKAVADKKSGKGEIDERYDIFNGNG
jgi:hypothetical protein